MWKGLTLFFFSVLLWNNYVLLLWNRICRENAHFWSPFLLRFDSDKWDLTQTWLRYLSQKMAGKASAMTMFRVCYRFYIDCHYMTFTGWSMINPFQYNPAKITTIFWFNFHLMYHPAFVFSVDDQYGGTQWKVLCCGFVPCCIWCIWSQEKILWVQ